MCCFNGYYIGLNAAHIKWHQANGPDTVDNGVTLCSLHHKLFDRGVFTIDDQMKIIVSGNTGRSEIFNKIMFLNLGKEISKPIRPSYYPEDIYLMQHADEVFHQPGRYIY